MTSAVCSLWCSFSAAYCLQSLWARRGVRTPWWACGLIQAQVKVNKTVHDKQLIFKSLYLIMFTSLLYCYRSNIRQCVPLCISCVYTSLCINLTDPHVTIVRTHPNISCHWVNTGLQCSFQYINFLTCKFQISYAKLYYNFDIILLEFCYFSILRILI